MQNENKLITFSINQCTVKMIVKQAQGDCDGTGFVFVSAARRVARNSQWGGCLGGLGAEPPAAGGQWEAGGLGAKPPAAGGTGVWGQSPQRSKILHFFAKITSF